MCHLEVLDPVLSDIPIERLENPTPSPFSLPLYVVKLCFWSQKMHNLLKLIHKQFFGFILSSENFHLKFLDIFDNIFHENFLFLLQIC